jgi:hypothetical protein
MLLFCLPVVNKSVTHNISVNVVTSWLVGAYHCRYAKYKN